MCNARPMCVALFVLRPLMMREVRLVPRAGAWPVPPPISPFQLSGVVPPQSNAQTQNGEGECCKGSEER
jgi:hypothetical protein